MGTYSRDVIARPHLLIPIMRFNPVVLEDQATHVALPRLYGQPSYSRRRGAVPDRPRPIDPDDLPISALQTDDERDLAETLESRRSLPYVTVPYATDAMDAPASAAASAALEPAASMDERLLEAPPPQGPSRRRGLGRLLGG